MSAKHTEENYTIKLVKEGDSLWKYMVTEFPECVAWLNDPKDDGDYSFYCAVDHDQNYLGGAVIDIGEEDGGPLKGEVFGFLEEIEVSLGHRRKGIGKTLMQAVLQEAWSRNAQHVRWFTELEDETAIAFYNALGFALYQMADDNGEQTNQFLGVAANPYRMKLRFVSLRHEGKMRRNPIMKRFKAGSKKQPFPIARPPVMIKNSKAKPFAVDCGECWRRIIVPEVGTDSISATYTADPDAPSKWRLWDVSHYRVERPAAIHGVRGVEVLSDRWEAETGWVRDVPTRSFLRLTPTHFQWLGELSTECSCFGPEFQVLHTFLDPEDEDWSDRRNYGTLEDQQSPRHIEDIGRYIRLKDGSYTENKDLRCQRSEGLGSGIFKVVVGERSFTCLRVMEIDGDMPDVLDVAFITRTGRTVLHRRYEENHCIPSKVDLRGYDTWTEAYPENDRIILDGRTFVVWYERIAAFAFGFNEL